MNDITQRVLIMRDAGAVKRCHTCRTLKERNVAEHSHGLAMIVLLLYQAQSMVPSGNLLAAALCHDLSEIATGDIPAPVKREYHVLRTELNRITTDWELGHDVRYSITDEEAKLLSWSDAIDFALYSLEEVKMGNRYFTEYLERILGWLDDMPLPTIEGQPSAAYELLGNVRRLAKLEIHNGR